MDPEDRILLLAKGGSKEARSELGKLVINRIPSRLRVEFKEASYQDIDDGIQYAMIQFFQNPLAINATTMVAFLSWTYKVAKNYILNQLKSAERKYCDSFYILAEDGNEVEIPLIGIDGEEAFLKAIMSKRNAFLLSLAMATLNSEDYKLVGDFHLKNVSLDTLAAELNVSVDAVKKRKQRALLKLRAKLEDLGLSPEDL